LAWSTTYKGTPDSETFHRVHCIACEVYFPNMHCREPEGASKAIITSTVTGSKKLQIFISFSVHFQISGDIRIGNNLASVNLDLLRRHLIHHPIIQSQSSFITTNKPEAVLCSQAAHPEPPLQSQQLLRHPIFHTF